MILSAVKPAVKQQPQDRGTHENAGTHRQCGSIIHAVLTDSTHIRTFCMKNCLTPSILHLPQEVFTIYTTLDPIDRFVMVSRITVRQAVVSRDVRCTVDSYAMLCYGTSCIGTLTFDQPGRYVLPIFPIVCFPGCCVIKCSPLKTYLPNHPHTCMTITETKCA